MLLRPLTLALTLSALASLAVPRAVSAQQARPAAGGQTAASPRAGAGDGDRDALVSERQRLRLELGRVNAEIDRLKRSERSLGSDYRLRARLADAEAIARRLTEIDARLQPPGVPAPAAGAVAPRLGTEPGVTAADGPAELEAKADILADQARRAQGEARALAARASDLRGRRELRRRSGELEHDPFAPLEGSKRRAVTGAGVAPGSPRSGTRDGTTPAGVGPAFASPQGAASAGAPSVYLRDVLDAGTLAEIRKLEQAGTPSSDIDAIERAVAALEQRARHLEAQSRALREQATRR